MILDNRYIQNKTLSGIKSDLDSIRQIDLQTIEISELENIIGEIILGHSRTPYHLKEIEGLIRARKNIGQRAYKNIKCFSYPKWKLISENKWDFGRCNDKGESMFYSTTETDTAMIEVRPQKNEHLTLIEYVPKRSDLEIRVQVIGVRHLKELSRYDTIFKNHQKEYDKLNSDIKDKNDLINDFLDENFMQSVNRNESWKYKLSIAITKILLKDPSFDGLLYPSIAINNKGANILLKPEFSDSNFTIRRLGVYEAKNVTANSIEIEKKLVPNVRRTNLNSMVKWRHPTSEEREQFEIQF